MAGGILIFNIILDFYCLHKKIKFKEYLKYVPGIIALFLFLLLFKLNNGWVIHNTVSKAWESSGELASFYQMLRNTAIFIWRLIDFGRAGIFLFFLFFIIKTISLRRFQDNSLKILFLIIISQFVVFFPVIITSQNPFGHRYLLSMIIPAIILTVFWIRNYMKLSSLWLVLTFVVLFSGHFWLYPLKISKGWDATTMHWKYFKVSEKMNFFIVENRIDKKEIGTFFPNQRSRYLTHLEEDQNDTYSGVPFKNEYILYSNSFNVADEVIDSLYSENSHWKLIKRFSENRVFMSLYGRK